MENGIKLTSSLQIRPVKLFSLRLENVDLNDNPSLWSREDFRDFLNNFPFLFLLAPQTFPVTAGFVAMSTALWRRTSGANLRSSTVRADWTCSTWSREGWLQPRRVRIERFEQAKWLTNGLLFLLNLTD